MKSLPMVFVGVLVLVLAGPGLTQQGIGTPPKDSAQDRISVWDDTTAQRLLNHATGQAVPENSLEKIDVQYPHFAHALRISSATSGTENKWSTQYRLVTKAPIASGDVLVLALTLRSVQDPGRAFLAFGTAQPPHVNPFARFVDVGPQWQDVQFPLRATQDYPAGQAKISIGFGAVAQTLDLGRIELFNFKNSRSVSDFADSSSYRGRKPDAAWRKAAWERIETIRKADVRIEVVDGGGRPVPDATVRLRMTAHAFRFGSTFNPHIFQDQLTDPERLLDILDRFARYKLPLQVTEFDVSIDDEELQADYLRDFFLACFSHPSVELLQQWGFWERVHWRPKAALFRADWSAKPNGRQFLDLVHNRWKTKATGTTDANGRFSVRGFLGDYELTVEKDGRVLRQVLNLPKAGHRVRLLLTSGSPAAASI